MNEEDLPLAEKKLNRPKPVVLLLIDGWGIAPKSEANAIALAKTPVFLNLIKEYPAAVLKTFGKNLNINYFGLGTGKEIVEEISEPTLSLAKIIADSGLSQIKISETERFAPLTHFFNGNNEDKVNGEEWTIVSSESGDHDNKPALALRRNFKELKKAVEENKYDFILASWPLLDLVARSGDFKEVSKAAGVLDSYLKKLLISLADKGGVLIISAAHGNAERMKNVATDLADSEITDNPVPFIIVGAEFKGRTIGLTDTLDNDLSLLEPAGTIADIAPTILKILNIEKPAEMTGESLI